MSFLRELLLRLCWVFRRSRFRSELAEEIQFHIESRATELKQRWCYSFHTSEELMPCEDIAFHRRIYKSQLFPVWRRHAPGIPGRFAQHMHLARELDVLEPVLRCRSRLCEEALTV
jgi:hypothetical protein